MNTEKVKALFEKSKDKHGDASKIGISYQSMLNIQRGADVKVSTLEKIARYYNVPVGYFFDEAEADGKSCRQMEIEQLRGQIRGMEAALDRLGMSIQPRKKRS